MNEIAPRGLSAISTGRARATDPDKTVPSFRNQDEYDYVIKTTTTDFVLKWIYQVPKMEDEKDAFYYVELQLIFYYSIYIIIIIILKNDFKNCLKAAKIWALEFFEEKCDIYWDTW